MNETRKLVRGSRPVPRATQRAEQGEVSFASSPEPLQIVTDLELQSVIGQGGMGIVFRVYDRSLQRPIAMKVLKSEIPQSALPCLAQEALVTGRLEHPGIVPVYGAGQDDGGNPDCFTMKYVDGVTLTDRLLELSKLGTPPRGRHLQELLTKFLKVCESVSFAHSRGVLHRDIKPDNIMLGSYGEVYLMDWGLALLRSDNSERRVSDAAPKHEQPKHEQHGPVVGTPHYMAPEAIRCGPYSVDERTDVFSLGAVLYEMLTLVPPYDFEDDLPLWMLSRNDTIKPPEQVTPDAPPPAQLCDIVMQALSHSPDDRQQSAEQLRQDIETFLYAGGWFTRRQFASGCIVAHEGEEGGSAYIVEKGRCRVYCETDGATKALRELGPGECFGELALLTSGKRTATVEALTDVTLLEVSSDVFERELPRGSWTRQFVDTLAERFLQSERDQRRRPP
ncbi:MAG: protein kinase [Proteobacteria bacterium]|nr:protein kinase [Pseudomonadota bacterium]